MANHFFARTNAQGVAKKNRKMLKIFYSLQGNGLEELLPGQKLEFAHQTRRFVLIIERVQGTGVGGQGTGAKGQGSGVRESVN